MEKFSAYRDPATGIQPFLVPVPPANVPHIFQAVAHLLGSVLGAFRLAIILLAALLYLILVEALCLLFTPLPPLYHALTRGLTSVLGKLTLLSLGIYWAPVETTARKRTGRHARQSESWSPSAGDLIISNWASWIEIIWLAARCNPIFVLPVPEFIPQFGKTTHTSAPITDRPGRATGTGSANVQTSQKHSSVPSVPIKGFCQVSLLRMISITGRVPPYFGSDSTVRPLEEIRRSAGRPIAVFPECTTTNGRGILRFAKIFDQEIPVRGYQVFIMCVRYDPPTASIPTLTRPVPLPAPAFLNPISHIFKITRSVTTPTVSIRLLAPSESPSSQLFIASDYIKGTPGEDQLSEASANLISQIGRLKRTGLSWEDKASFFHYRNLKQG